MKRTTIKSSSKSVLLLAVIALVPLIVGGCGTQVPSGHNGVKYFKFGDGTEMGKIYYKCSNGDCDFISWGKPYHFACPQCNNPFLVEKSKGMGKTILKCPRATCHYWQRHPSEAEGQPTETAGQVSQKTTNPAKTTRKPRRKVVRRRVVRKKR